MADPTNESTNPQNQPVGQQPEPRPAVGPKTASILGRLPIPPRWIIGLLVLAVVASWIPLVLIARARAMNSKVPRVHLFQGMDNQAKFKAQSVNRIYADSRAMRQPAPGTIARGQLRNDDHYYRGRVGQQWAESYPEQVTLDEALLIRGREMFNVHCATCHGRDGAGNGMIHQRAQQLQVSGWVPPSNLHDETRRGRPLGHLYNSITNGIRNMSPYGHQVQVEDRWAIVAYIKALQLSQHAELDKLPQEMAEDLRENLRPQQ